MKIIYLSAVLLPVFLFVSCTSEQKKTPTPEVQTTEKAFNLVQEIRNAFIRKDARELKRLCSEKLAGELIGQMDKFKDMSLELNMRWVDIEKDGTINLYVSWKRTAVQGGKPANDSGMADFIIKNNPLTAESILRENPFL